jgi:hypothetical protein
VLGCVLIIAVVNTAEATVLSQDDFEGVTATSVYPVTGTTTYYPGSMWTMQNQDAQSIAVYDDPTAAGGEGSQVLCLKKAASNVPMVKTDFANSQTAILSFDLYVPSSNKDMRTLNLNLQDVVTPTNVRTASYLAINKGNNGWGICAIDASYTWRTIVTPKLDQWAPVVVNADAVSKTFTLTYDGVTYNNNGYGYQFFDWGDGLAFNRLFFSQSGAGVDTRIDNVKVLNSVPEPTTIGLLAMGGLILRRKWMA